jgi:hypothetical protein
MWHTCTSTSVYIISCNIHYDLRIMFHYASYTALRVYSMVVGENSLQQGGKKITWSFFRHYQLNNSPTKQLITPSPITHYPSRIHLSLFTFHLSPHHPSRITHSRIHLSPFTFHLSPFTPSPITLSPFTFHLHHPSPITHYPSPITHSPFTFHLSPFTFHPITHPSSRIPHHAQKNRHIFRYTGSFIY